MTLADLAEAVGCARSYLSAIENEQRAAPSPEMLGKMEMAMRLRAGTLIEAAQWQSAPAMVKRHVAAMQTNQRVTRELVDAVREGEGGLDALYRSGQLRRMIEKLSGPEGASGNAGATGAGAGAGVAPITLPVEVPLINSVAAGYPTEFTDLGYPARVADQYVRTPDICDPDAFAARVVGDSMEPDYREGDIVVFSPARTVASGMDCFVRLEPDHATTFKRVFFESDERRVTSDEKDAKAKAVTHIRLQPLNPKYPSKVLEREQVAGVYAAVSVTRSVG